MNDPRFSVIIPAYNRSHALQECINALALQSYPRELFEVIVVDDGSEPPLKSTVKRGEGRLDIRYHRQGNMGPAAARNRGANVAGNKFLAFTDDDCLPETSWLANIAKTIVEHPGCVVAGRTVNQFPENPFAEASQHIVDALLAWNMDKDGFVHFFTSNNLVLPRDTFFAFHGFDCTFHSAAGEDYDLCNRLLEAGCSIIFAPKAVVRHKGPTTIRGFLNQQYAYGKGAYLVRKLRSRRSGKPFRTGPPGLYLHIFKTCFNASSIRSSFLTVLLVAVSQAAVCAGMLKTMWSGHKKNR